jgi:hypothetical protein
MRRVGSYGGGASSLGLDGARHNGGHKKRMQTFRYETSRRTDTWYSGMMESTGMNLGRARQVDITGSGYAAICETAQLLQTAQADLILQSSHFVHGVSSAFYRILKLISDYSLKESQPTGPRNKKLRGP